MTRVDCNDCVERLYAFLDTELTKSELEQVRLHLDGCADCDDNFVFEARFLEQLRDCCTSDVAPADLRERVIRKLRGGHASAS
jgi:mycothiol system anti-sigma-R factor